MSGHDLDMRCITTVRQFVVLDPSEFNRDIYDAAAGVAEKEFEIPPVRIGAPYF